MLQTHINWKLHVKKIQSKMNVHIVMLIFIHEDTQKVYKRQFLS